MPAATADSEHPWLAPTPVSPTPECCYGQKGNRFLQARKVPSSVMPGVSGFAMAHRSERCDRPA